MPTGAQISELNRETSAHALLSFVVLSHPLLPGGVLRYVTDVLPFVWRGDQYEPIGGMDLPLADDGESASRLRVSIPNIDRRVGQIITRANSRIKVDQHLLSSADFDLSADPRTEIGTASVIYSMRNFETLSANYDAVAVDISLILRDFSQARYGRYATQLLLPGAFR